MGHRSLEMTILHYGLPGASIEMQNGALPRAAEPVASPPADGVDIIRAAAPNALKCGRHSDEGGFPVESVKMGNQSFARRIAHDIDIVRAASPNVPAVSLGVGRHKLPAVAFIVPNSRPCL